jgi:thiol:disulfide interchange protein
MNNFLNYLNLSNISPITYLIVFIAGLATSFTPCVYPLIPIVVGVIGSAKESSRGRNFLLSFIYVLGMAVTFSLLGVVSALTGSLFGQLQSSPLAQIIVGSIIILFALALLDIIALPAFLLNRIGAAKINKTGTLFSVFLMGAASGFVVAPCTVAVLGALLTYVATTQNVLVGFSLLFTFALGLGAIFMLIGSFTAVLRALPKAKKWTRLIQKAVAFSMIILGGYFIFKGVLSWF